MSQSADIPDIHPSIHFICRVTIHTNMTEAIRN